MSYTVLKLLTWFLVLLAVVMPNRAEADLPDLPTPPYLVFDATSGTVHSRHREFDRWAPASLTKMMTAYTAFKALRLQHLAMNSPVRVSENAIAQPPSKMGFPIGTVMTIETAIKIIMVKSANDIAVALAEAVAGDEQAFIKLMNAHARRLGMTDTNFTNPHGLHDPDQYTTARDMGILTLALTEEFPEHAEFFDIPAIRITGRRLRNHNALLRLFEGTDGMKTGYVCASGYNVAVRTKRKNSLMVAVVFGGRSGLERNIRAAQILTQAFKSETPANLVLFDELTKPTGTSNEPYDITRVTCPRKYASQSVPRNRPEDAPSAQDFDGIDTIVIEARLEREKNPLANIPLPKPRPHDLVQATAEINVDENTAVRAVATDIGATNEPDADKPRSLKELSKIYLVPHGNLRKDVRLALAGGTGPNPFGIRHTNGGVYKAPIPVPQKRPALDLVDAQE